MKHTFSIGQEAFINGDFSGHGIKNGSSVIIEGHRMEEKEYWILCPEKRGGLWHIHEKELKSNNDINADIQAALDPNNYQRLTESNRLHGNDFNRVSSFEGGGYINLGYNNNLKVRE